jgi:hypothetical protein
VIPEEGEAPRERSPRDVERDVLAERRARRAWLSSPALARRAEAAEATVHTLEAHLGDLRRRQLETERERELAAARLAERELELRRVKQREYAEQQLRVEAEEYAVRLRRGHRAELDRMRRRAEEALAAAQHAEEQRDALAARFAEVDESCARLQRGVAALQSVTVGLRTTFERDHLTAQARIRELEGELGRALARAMEPTRPIEDRPDPPGRPATGGTLRHKDALQHGDALRTGGALRDEDVLRTGEAIRREEMAGALAAAVERLRTRVATTAEEPENGRAPEVALEQAAADLPQLDPGPPEVPTVIVVPRLFAARGRGVSRLAPAVRRVAVRLTEWADRAR